jgi:hypothetical protein
MTLDESWFYRNIDWEQQWLLGDNEPRTKTRRGADRDKTMLTTVWSTTGFLPIDTMLKGEKYTARCFIDNILTPICGELILHGIGKLVIHGSRSRRPNAQVVLEFVPQQKDKLPHIRHLPQTEHPLTFSFSAT